MENPLWAHEVLAEDRKWSMAESHHLENMKDSSITKSNNINNNNNNNQEKSHIGTMRQDCIDCHAWISPTLWELPLPVAAAYDTLQGVTFK